MSAKQRRKRSSPAGNPEHDRPAGPGAGDKLGWLVWPLLLWVGAVHISGVYGAFVFDDQALLDNEALTEFWGFEWFRLTKRPVTTATFAWQFTMTGVSSMVSHVANILIHLAGVACLFALLRSSLRAIGVDGQLVSPLSAAVALVWGVHPLGTAAVTYIIQRAESLATLGMLTTLYAWSRAFGQAEKPQAHPSYGWACLAIVAAWLAYGAKEISAGLPLIVLMYDRIFIAKSAGSTRKRWPWILVLTLPLLLGAALFLPRLSGAGADTRTIGFDIQGMTPFSYFASQPRVFLEYLKLSVVPIGQSLDYGWLPPREIQSQLLGCLGWLIMAVATIAIWKRSAVAGFLIVAALLVLAPTSTFLPLQDIIFEHRFYFPLACLTAGLIGWVSLRFLRPSENEHAGACYRPLMMAVIIAIPLSMLTVLRNQNYVSVERITRIDIENHPDNPRAWMRLASVTNFDRPEPKIEMFHRAIELAERRDHFYAGTAYQWRRALADLYFLLGRNEESRSWYQQALPHSHNDLQRVETIFSLAMIASIQARVDEANRLFEQALETDTRIRADIEAAYRAHRSRTERNPDPTSADPLP